MADTSYTPNESAELPFSLEAEQTILGAILLDSSVLPVVLETIRPESFFNEQHKELFQIIFQMFTSGEKADVITVLNAAVERKVFETAAEGRNYLAALVNIVPSVSNIERYCEIVAEKILHPLPGICGTWHSPGHPVRRGERTNTDGCGRTAHLRHPAGQRCAGAGEDRGRHL